MKIVIVSNEMVGPSKNGGIGSFTTALAKLVSRSTEHNVTIVYTGQVFRPRGEWIGIYDTDQITVVEAPEPQYDVLTYGNEWFVNRSEGALVKIPADADVIFFQENNADGFSTIRNHRFNPKKYPVIVTVMHSSSDWIRHAMCQLPRLSAPTGNFAEYYGVKHSDYVVSLSQYLLDWVVDYGWEMPQETRVLRGPFLPSDPTLMSRKVSPASHFKRIVFFGRLETRKGFELLVDGLRQLATTKGEDLFREINEVVFLGRDANHRYGTAAQAAHLLEQTGKFRVKILNNFDTWAAQHYLADNAKDTLVIMPSLIDNHPYAVVESSLIAGLNLICANNGAQPEILGPKSESQLFDPNLQSFTRKLREWLLNGPKHDRDLAHYPLEEANQNWINFTEEACQLARERKEAAENASESPIQVSSKAKPYVDICISCHTYDSMFLPYLLESLEKQTWKQFNIYVAIDTSDATANQIMRSMQSQYKAQGATFIALDKWEGHPEAFDAAAAQGQAEYLLFMKPTSYAAPQMIMRFLEALAVSGDDCLTSYVYAFEGNSPTASYSRNDLLRPPKYLYKPLGGAPEIGLLWNCFGRATDFIVKRTAFESVGGFKADHEYVDDFLSNDYGILVNFALAGYKLDVVPEYLIFHHYTPSDPNPFHIDFRSYMRAQQVYRKYLSQIGLTHLAGITYGLGVKHQEFPWPERSASEFNNQGISEANIHDPNWLASNMSMGPLARGIGHKVLKHVRRVLPFMS